MRRRRSRYSRNKARMKVSKSEKPQLTIYLRTHAKEQLVKPNDHASRLTASQQPFLEHFWSINVYTFTRVRNIRSHP
jgi:hypothetical protein